MNEENDCSDEIEKLYFKILPFIKEYNVSKVKYNRIVKKMHLKPLEFKKIILAFFKDLDKVHERIQGIKKAPLARTPGYWENYRIMFTSPYDGEKLPELDIVVQLEKQFRTLVTGFLKHNRHYYVRTKKIDTKTSQQSDSGNQI